MTGLTRLDPYATTAEAVTFEAHVKNFGLRDVSGRVLEFFVDRRRVRQEQLDVPAGEEKSVVYSYRFSTPGELIEIGHKALDRDVFARGALKAGDWLVKQAPGYYSSSDWLGLNR